MAVLLRAFCLPERPLTLCDRAYALAAAEEGLRHSPGEPATLTEFETPASGLDPAYGGRLREQATGGAA